MTSLVDPGSVTSFPNWVPPGAQNYLLHTEKGLSIRSLARDRGLHASTVMRQVRRIENRRDDPLIDQALRRLSAATTSIKTAATKDTSSMTAPIRHQNAKADDAAVDQEARRILRRMCETGAVLAVARDMEKAVVMRTAADGSTTRTAVVDRPIAEAMALRDWIVCKTQGRISRYDITAAGRSALKRLLSEQDARCTGDVNAFTDQHREWSEKSILENDGSKRRVRYNLAESPLAGLARRKDKDGAPFLSDDLVTAGERLREDFELAQLGPKVAQNWDRFLTGGDRGAFSAGDGSGPANARERVSKALRDLGPGLGDVVLRCCCFLEGMEAAEKRMGWSARSGKIVLRIALQRLKRHYEEAGHQHGPMIG